MLTKRLKGGLDMSDNIAVLDGFTEQFMAYSSDGLNDMFIMVKPNTDMDGTFKAWDSDNQEYAFINGWLWSFERVAE
jgi:hypothetical protein